MLAIQARRKAQRRAWRETVNAAWLNAVLQRAKKVPTPDELLGDDPDAAVTPRTEEEHLNYQLSALSRWSAISIGQFGLPPPTTGDVPT